MEATFLKQYKKYITNFSSLSLKPFSFHTFSGLEEDALLELFVSGEFLQSNSDSFSLLETSTISMSFLKSTKDSLLSFEFVLITKTRPFVAAVDELILFFLYIFENLVKSSRFLFLAYSKASWL